MLFVKLESEFFFTVGVLFLASLFRIAWSPLELPSLRLLSSARCSSGGAGSRSDLLARLATGLQISQQLLGHRGHSNSGCDSSPQKGMGCSVAC